MWTRREPRVLLSAWPGPLEQLPHERAHQGLAESNANSVARSDDCVRFPFEIHRGGLSGWTAGTIRGTDTHLATPARPKQSSGGDAQRHQLSSQLHQSASDASFGRAQWYAQRGGHPLMGQLFEECHRHGLALRLGQDLEGAPDDHAPLVACNLLSHTGSIVGKAVEKSSVRVRFKLRASAPATQLVDDAPASDLEVRLNVLSRTWSKTRSSTRLQVHRSAFAPK